MWLCKDYTLVKRLTKDEVAIEIKRIEDENLKGYYLAGPGGKITLINQK